MGKSNSSKSPSRDSSKVLKKSDSRGLSVKAKRHADKVIRVSLNGRMVTPYQEKIKRNNLMQTMMDSAKVQWMFLEDAAEQCRDQFLMESTNSGIVSALLLSCMFSYMMTIPDMDWDIIAEQWGAATIWDSPGKNSTGDSTGDSSTLPVWIRFGVKSGEEVAKIHRDVLTLFSFLSFVTFLVACINSLIGTFMMGETTGDLEARIWIDALGFKAKSSFIFLLAGILWLAIVVLYHYFIYCYFVVTILVGFGFAIVVIVGAYMFLDFFPMMQALFAVKEMTYQNSPIAPSAETMKRHLQSFCENVGAKHIGPDILHEYMKFQYQKPGEPPVVFTRSTIRLIEAMADEVIDSYIKSANVADMVAEINMATQGKGAIDGPAVVG